MTKPREQFDAIWAGVYVQRYHPKAETVEYQAPLYDTRGIPDADLREKGLMFFGRMYPRADILIKEAGRWTLVEIKPRAFVRDVTNLDFYLDALLHDVVRKVGVGDIAARVFVTDRDDDRIKAACRGKDIKFVVIPGLTTQLPPKP